MKKLFFALALAIVSITSAVAQTKMGHVDSQKVLDTIPSRRAAIAEIGIIEQNGVKELTGMDSTLNAMVEYYQKHPEWSQLVKQSYENQMRELQGRISSREQSIDRELQAYSADVNKKSLETVKTAVGNVSKLRKLTYVIDKSVLLYSDGGEDITADVINEVLKLDKAASTPKPQ